MKTFLFIAEKPSLMRDVKSCYNKHKTEVQNKVGDIEFIALAGHVCAYFAPNDYDKWSDAKWDEVQYPMIPEKWGIKPIGDKKSIIDSIRKKAASVDGIIVGTDSDVEGYGIYYLLEQFLGLKNKTALRFIEHSLTDKEILESLLSMTDFHTDPTHVRFTQSYIVRSHCDWLFGYNATRMVSIKEREIMRVGRVKAPTISLVYKNSTAIENFRPRKYFTLHAHYGNFSAVYSKDKNPVQFDGITNLPQIPLDGIVTEKITARTEEHAPKLFDLTAIQAEAGRKYGFAPERTLELVQSLYEKHKVVSYPRTQCRYVSSERAKDFPDMLEKVMVFDDLAKIIVTVPQEQIFAIKTDKMVVNDAEVSKESHDALLPTSNTPDLSAMSKDEVCICHMIYQRLVAQFMPKLTVDKTELVIRHGEFDFIAKGKAIVEQGWAVLYKEQKDNILPVLSKGDALHANTISPQERKTTPPKRLTQATLINAMQNIATQIEDKELRKSLAESKGIGTPATRASLISEIIKSGYIEDRKDGLHITPLGKSYISSIQSLEMINPVFAAKLDTEIKKVQRGEVSFDDAMHTMMSKLDVICKQIEGLPQKAYSPSRKVVNAQCPKCRVGLVEQKFTYNCPDCGLKIQKNVCGKEIDEKLLQLLLAGKISPIFSMKKKNGEIFKSALCLDSDYNIVFSSGIKCPVCKQSAKMNRGGIFCDCGFKLFRNCAGHAFTDAELKSLLKGKTLSLTDCKSKKGTTFSASATMNNDGTIKLEFV